MRIGTRSLGKLNWLSFISHQSLDLFSDPGIFFVPENHEWGPIITRQNINKQFFSPWGSLHGIRYDGIYVVTGDELQGD